MVGKKVNFNLKYRLRKLRDFLKPDRRFKKIIYGLFCFLVLFHAWLYFSDPYSSKTFFKNPYSTSVENGQITYKENYTEHVHVNMLANLLGYYKSGFLIVLNTFFGAEPVKSQNIDEIIAEIHKQRFNPDKPYLISGDQFSVLYPRNLGVFYNQLLDPNTALDQEDWQNRQRIYLQSALYAIDGLAASKDPRTTVIPMGAKTSVLTEVHPGSIASDSVYGVLYAINQMDSQTSSDDKKYSIQTQQAIQKLLSEHKEQLTHLVNNYVYTVQDPKTKLVRQGLNLSSARDGVIRNCSFYDNVILWKTLQLASKYNLYQTSDSELAELKQNIKDTFWDDSQGFYKNDLSDDSFSSDWLIGYPSGFFNLDDREDQIRTEKIITYIRNNGLASPLPIKYQLSSHVNAPFFVSLFAPEYGADSIWSYWGSEYITLLANMYGQTKDKSYFDEAEKDLSLYSGKMLKYGGFPETFDPEGNMLHSSFYKSILITGWVVEYEHAAYLVQKFRP